MTKSKTKEKLPKVCTVIFCIVCVGVCERAIDRERRRETSIRSEQVFLRSVDSILNLYIGF